jgi:AcrR family transcriptional regulator
LQEIESNVTVAEGSIEAHATPRYLPTRRSAAKHRKIVAAAISLVAEQGYHATTVEAVAARAEAGKQTIYRWWPSKAALFVEVYGALVPAAELRHDTGSVATDLRGLLRALFALYRATPAALILAGLIAEAQHDPMVRDAVRSGLVLGRRDLLSEPLQRGVDRGELPGSFDVAWASEVIVGLIWHRLLTGGEGLTDRFADRLVDHILRNGRSPR